jgi:uncharacterized membrane protein
MMRAILGLLETVVLGIVLTLAAVWIALLLAVAYIARIIAGIASDPNAGPYRQVR